MWENTYRRKRKVNNIMLRAWISLNMLFFNVQATISSKVLALSPIMWTGAQYCYPEMFLLAFFELKVLSVPNVKQMFWLPHSINTFPNFNHKVSTHTEGSIV